MSGSPNFFDWYWSVVTNPNSVFSSARGIYVPLSDQAYVTWLSVFKVPTPIDSEQSLLQVLAQAAPDVVMLTPAGLSAYAAVKQQAVMTGGISVNVGTTGTPKMVHASTDPASLILLQGATTVASTTPTTVFNWVPNTGIPIILTAAQMTTLFGAVVSFLQATFTTLSQVLSAITAGTITTKAAVDTPPSPIPAWPANS